MKRAALVAFAAVFLVGCQDDQLPSEPSPSFQITEATPQDIEELIGQLFPPGGLRNAALVRFRNIGRQLTRDVEDARGKMFDLVDFTVKRLELGQLLDPDPATAAEAVSELINLLFLFVDLGSAEIDPAIFEAEDFAVQVVPPEGATVLTNTAFAGVDIEDEDLNETILVTIRRLDQNPCLPTGLIQSEGCWEFNRFPAGQFDAGVEVAVCVDLELLDPALNPLVRLHKFAPEVGVVVLEPTPGDIGVECATFTALNSPGSNGLRHFARALTGRLATLLGPRPLFASAVIDRPKRLGGTIGSFTDFGGAIPVDVAISAGNNQTAGVGTAVPIDPTVHVTDSTGADLEGVAIIWLPEEGAVSQDTVLTDSDGLASVIWTLGVEGTNTLIATTAAQGDSVVFTATGVANRLLVFGEARGASVIGADGTTFQGKAAAAGYDITVYNATQWSSATTANFASFHVIGVPTLWIGETAAAASLAASNGRWGPAVTGNIVVSGLHADEHADAGATTFLENALAFASSGTGTGFVSLVDCSAWDDVPPLDAVYTWVPSTGPLSGLSALSCLPTQNVVVTNPGHPVMAGLTNVLMSNWGQSVHTIFTSTGGFSTVAIATGAGAGPAPTGSPVVLVWPSTSPPSCAICIDGILSPGEWSAADNVGPVTVNLPGGGTTTATVFVTNDATDLLLAVRFDQDLSIFQVHTLSVRLDEDLDNAWTTNGEDGFTIQHKNVSGTRVDRFFDSHFNTSVSPPQGQNDTAHGGTNDGQTAVNNDGSTTVIEMSHPLNSGDALDAAFSTGVSYGLHVFTTIRDPNPTPPPTLTTVTTDLIPPWTSRTVQ